MRVAVVLSAAVAVAGLAAGCAGSDGGAVDGPSSGERGTVLLEPLPTAAPTAAATTMADTTVPDDPVDAAVEVPEGATRLSPDGPWRLVDSAPGVDGHGLVYELMPGLWAFLPYEQDLAQGIVWTFHERDRELVEDWLRAMTVYFRATTSYPMTFGDDVWEEWFPVRDMAVVDMLATRRSNGYHVELDMGMVLRPEVLGEQRTDTTAIVFDCEYDGTIVVDRAGDVVPPSAKGFIDDGMGYRMELIDGAWRVMAIGSQDNACM